MAANDGEALEIARRIFENLAAPPPPPSGFIQAEDPYYDPTELYGIVPADNRRSYDVREVIARLVDGSRFQEFKELYGTTLITGFATHPWDARGHHRQQRRVAV